MTAPKIQWYVIPDGGKRMPHTTNMRGRWGWDATCSCGWDSRTGGATKRSVKRAVADHLLDHGIVRAAWL